MAHSTYIPYWNKLIWVLSRENAAGLALHQRTIPWTLYWCWLNHKPVWNTMCRRSTCHFQYIFVVVTFPPNTRQWFIIQHVQLIREQECGGRVKLLFPPMRKTTRRKVDWKLPSPTVHQELFPQPVAIGIEIEPQLHVQLSPPRMEVQNTLFSSRRMMLGPVGRSATLLR